MGMRNKDEENTRVENSTPNINDDSLKPLKISTFVRNTSTILIG